jgi:hypothetical protein
VEPDEDAAAGEDEVEAAAKELERELVDVGVHIGDVGCALAGDVERLGRDVHGSHEGAELDELGGRLAGRALKVEHVLARDIREQLADRRRDPELALNRGRPPAMDLVPGLPVLVSGLHGSQNLVTQCYKEG